MCELTDQSSAAYKGTRWEGSPIDEPWKGEGGMFFCVPSQIAPLLTKAKENFMLSNLLSVGEICVNLTLSLWMETGVLSFS